LCLSKTIGCIRQHTVVIAEDESGNPALWWLSHKGPYRLSQYGLEYCGQDNQDVWDSVNLGATTVTAHGVFVPELHQIWWWVSTGSNNTPDIRMCVDTRYAKSTENGVRGGWSKHNGGLIGTCLCSTMFANTVGASMSRDLKPYAGRSTGTSILKYAYDTTISDSGTKYQAYVKLRPLAPWGLGMNGRIGQTVVIAKTGTGQALTLTEDRNFGLETKTSTVSLVADGSETRCERAVEGSGFASGGVYQLQVGDGDTNQDYQWKIDALIVPYTAQERHRNR
jgi:hypothetical protein